MAFYDDPYFIGTLVIIGTISVVILREILSHKEVTKDLETKGQRFTQPSKTQSMFDMVPMVLGEINSMGEEQAMILKSFGLSDDQVQKAVMPVRKRYDKLKWLQENQNWTMPLINVGEKAINNIVKMFTG